MLFLHKLWKGDVAPGEQRYRPNREYGKQFHKMEQCEQAINAELSDAGKVAFADYADAVAEVKAMGECDNFIEGFRMGVMVMLDVFYPAESQEDSR